MDGVVLDDWPAQRDTLRRVATHVVAQAQARETGHFALVALPGGFGTPQFGDDRRRVRVTGGNLFIENARGQRHGEEAAVTDIVPIPGATIASLCTACGFDPDPGFWVGGDTPALGDVDTLLDVDPEAVRMLGDWYTLGQRAMDASIATLNDPQASVMRLWPEHFDLGIDLAVGADDDAEGRRRVNLGAAAGDGFHEQPYLYVGPWGDERPGPADFWNAPFGAVLGFEDLAGATDPFDVAVEFMTTGLGHLTS
ncbi:hypothetical protein [Ilumatobacter nonamiensis]|uniref:hypothetical protein n=1 Tax=Ilumatobacter nonamiensis TaxID=467093 RepID=UPI00034C3966|nr:hypothetical protein [Ilumatobacter nonamiensis]